MPVADPRGYHPKVTAHAAQAFRRRRHDGGTLLYIIVVLVGVIVSAISTVSSGESDFHTSPLRPLYLYTHLPKTGGTHFAHDLIKMSNVHACDRDLLCVHAERDYRVRPPNTTAIDSGDCNMLACEGFRDNILAHAAGSVRHAATKYAKAFPIAMARTLKARDIVMLRSPSDHVISMYAHCQQSGGIGQRQGYPPSGIFSPRPKISLSGWLALWEAGNVTEAKRYCEYDPRNLQTARLSLNGSNYEPDADFVTRNPDEDDFIFAARVVRNAAIVGVLEEYRGFLCIVQFRLWVAYQNEDESYPNSRLAYKQSTLSKCLEKAHDRPVTKENRFTHGTNTNKIAVDGDARQAIARLTKLDQRLYSMALTLYHSSIRFHQMVSSTGGTKVSQPIVDLASSPKKSQLPCPTSGSIVSDSQRVSVVLLLALSTQAVTECRRNKYIEQTQLAITSVRRMSVVPITLVWTTLDDDLAASNVHGCLVQQFAGIANFTLQRLWLPPANTLLYVRHPMMLKLVLPWAMPDYDKILVIDSDTIVIKDVLPLFEYPAPAITKSGISSFNGSDSSFEVKITYTTINSGVMLLPAAGSAPEWAAELLHVASRFGPQTCSDQEIWNVLFTNKLTGRKLRRKIHRGDFWDARNCSDAHLADHAWVGSMLPLQKALLTSTHFCPENGRYELPKGTHIQGPWENVKSEWVDAITTGRDLPNTPYILHRCCHALEGEAWKLYAKLRENLREIASQRIVKANQHLQETIT